MPTPIILKEAAKSALYLLLLISTIFNAIPLEAILPPNNVSPAPIAVTTGEYSGSTNGKLQVRRRLLDAAHEPPDDLPPKHKKIRIPRPVAVTRLRMEFQFGNMILKKSVFTKIRSPYLIVSASRGGFRIRYARS